MSKDKQEVRVWEIIFYTEDENGEATYYTTKRGFDHSGLSDYVDMEDLKPISKPNNRIQPTFSIGDGEPMI